MSRRHDPFTASLSILSILCVPGILGAQNFISEPATAATPQIITNHRQLSSMVLIRPAPEYPPIAKVNYLQGPVQIEITVNKSGRVSGAHVLKGNPILAAAALKAVVLWVYRPLATPAGASGFTARVNIKFALNHPQMELTPQKAEQDFERQVRPPQVTSPANQAQWGDVVRMRLLVDDEGRIVDTDSGRLEQAQLKPAMDALRNWTFHPAYWGTLPIAAYLNVDVPVNAQSSSVASISGTH